MKKYIAPQTTIYCMEAEQMLATSPGVYDKVSDKEALTEKKDMWNSDLWGTTEEE